jgi:hypothetical protein
VTSPRIDHVALEVDELERYIDLMCASGLLRLIRLGTLGRTGQRIAMLGDGTGTKVELIEDPSARAPRLAHLAFAVEDVDGARASLMEGGWEPVHGPNDLRSAKARSALLRNVHGLMLQVIRYEDDSPDLARGTDEGGSGVPGDQHDDRRGD